MLAADSSTDWGCIGQHEGGERGRGHLAFGDKNNVFRHGLKDCTEDELVFRAGGRLLHRTGAE